MPFVDLVFAAGKEFDSLAGELGNDRVLLAASCKDDAGFQALRKAHPRARLCLVLDQPDQRVVQRFRGKVDFLAVRGGSVEANKFAVSTKGVDFLFMPCDSGKLSFDTAIARLSAENNVPVAVSFADFLRCNGRKRSLLLKNYFMVVKLLKKFQANALFFSGASKPEELRAVKDLAAFAVLLGFSRAQGKRLVERFQPFFLGE
ncbi:MAG: hypothetical protein J4203_00540 [Candidatus Diapherotrites archaeon]|uniref:Uncharacterized protein n=1 Tax=Candidatus Iainarchaeum sp. TaxID=3101447 RepID=A0A8T4LGG5_9ARCH|nr:hypothetical protein [Candidatus Diapherotrites archaeon]